MCARLYCFINVLGLRTLLSTSTAPQEAFPLPSAIAMRHSSKIQASAAYNKGASDRRVSAAMKVVADYSAKFTAGASTSTNTN